MMTMLSACSRWDIWTPSILCIKWVRWEFEGCKVKVPKERRYRVTHKNSRVHLELF